MLVSHHHKFIFIKPRKVAGTTIELKLSPYLESGDYATPIEPHEECLRTYRSGVAIGRIRQQNKFRLPFKLRDHSTLKRAYSVLEQRVQTYYIITACRNPWDRALSQFFWSYRNRNILEKNFSFQRSEFNKFTKLYGPTNWLTMFYGRKKQRQLNSSHLYTINNKILANFAIRFEYLEKDLFTLKKFLGLNGTTTAENLRTKATFRPKESKNWQHFYDADTIELVRQYCSQEILSFNYSFEGNNNLKGPFLKL